MLQIWFKNQLQQEWRIKILKLIDECINFLETHSSKFKHSNKDFLQKKFIVIVSENLHTNVIVAQIGANSDTAFICKFLLVNNTSKTNAVVSNMSELNILNKHSSCIYNLTKTSLDQDEKYLATIYWLPKLYKTPTKAMHIIVALKCYLKLLPKAITSVLKLWYIQIESYRNKSHFVTAFKCF